MKTCQYCKKDMPDDAIFCPYCGRFGLIFGESVTSSSEKIALTSGTVLTYASTGSNILSKSEQHPDSPIFSLGASDFKIRWSDIAKEIDYKLREGDSALEKYNEVIRKQERATRIVDLIGTANIVMKTKKNAELFREDTPKIIDELHTSCEDENHFVTKICSLDILFDVPLAPLRKIVKKTNDWKSKKLVEEWLEENNMQYDPHMIMTWYYIGDLRNMFPVHHGIPERLPEILAFFDTAVPINHELLWDKILEKFAQSLEELNRILESI